MLKPRRAGRIVVPCPPLFDFRSCDALEPYVTLPDGQVQPSEAGGLTRGPQRRRASQVAGLAAATIAAAVLAGWWAGLPLLSSWGAGLPAMQPAGALCLAALGLALVFPGKDQRFAVATGVAVASLTALLLGAAFLGTDFGLAWLALRSPMPTAGPDAPAFRIVHVAALAFGFTGAALALSPFERYRPVATVAAGLAAAIAVFALLACLTGIDALYVSGALAAPPLPTAAGLLCVASGILLRIGAMPALRWPRSLWQLLTTLGCAILVPLLLFGAYAEVSISDAELDEVRRDLMHGAHAISADHDRHILSEIGRLQALAASPSLRQGDFAAFQRQAEVSLTLDQTGYILLVDRDMRVLVNTWMPYGSSIEKTSIPGPVETALATGKPQFTELFNGSVTGQVLFAIVLPVEIDGEYRYAVVRSISQRAVAEPIAAENLPPGWQGVVSNSRHHVLARTEPAPYPPPTGEDKPEADGQRNAIGTVLPPAQRSRGGTGGVFEFTGSDGRPALQGYAWSELTGWHTAVWQPKAMLEAPVRALWRTLGWLALLSLALVAALASWLGRIIAGSVGHAASAAVALGEGASQTPPDGSTPVAEVNMLMAELREAAARRDASECLLRDSERHLRLVTDNVPAAIAQCDAEGRCTFANRQFKERHGLTCGEIIGRPLRELIGEKAFTIAEPYIRECLAGHAVEFEFEAPDCAGEPIFLQGRFAPEWQDGEVGGEVVGLIGATSDITRLKQAEQRLRASEVTFRQLVDNSPFGIYVVDDGLRFVEASIGARKTFEHAQPLIGRDVGEVMSAMWPEPYAGDAIGHFRHTLATGEPYRAPGSVERRKDTGAIESYDWTIERVTLPDGRFGAVCHFYDLSERQRYEAALGESEATFRAMFDASSVGKSEIDVETGRYVRVNAAMCRFVGYSEAELLSRTPFDITHPDDREHDRESLCGMDSGALPVFDREKRYVRKDGKVVWARVTANTIRDVAGRPVRNTAVVQDLTDRKRAEQELEASRTRLQLALDAARLGWFQYDPARRSGRGDTRFREIFDFPTEEIPLETMATRLHPDDVENTRKSLAEHLDPVDPRPAVAEFRIQRRDGEVRWVELHGLAYFEGAGRERRAVSLIGTAQDITERKRHEEQTQLLMREVNHRAKNMLSVVDAIAHQTAARNPEDFIERFSERIQALSANQDLLVRNEWNGVGIEDLVRAQLAHFADLVGTRILVRGPRQRLKAASAQAIGLALHELSTNAGKYGALSTDKGRVMVRWRTEGDTFHMSWTECDGPAVSPPKRRGFGTVVMDVMAQRTVGGKVDLDYAPSGVRWRLTCPAENALETRD
jgi:PAS domain S-box-containing protein